ncbi:hypothetical protein OROHE_011274 [Orobanche hederae]
MPSQEILKIRDGTPLEAEEILTYINALETDRKLDVPSNVVQKKRVARILFFKIWSSQGILKVRDCTPMEAEEILTYIKSPRNGSVCYFSSKLDVPSNVVQKKRVARILFFKIRSSQEILKIRDGTYPFGGGGNFDIHKKPSKRIVARILFFKIRPYQEILKIRDGTSLEAEEILTYIRCPRNGSVCYFSSKLDVSINVVQKKKVAQILFFKIKSSQGILKILQKKRVARILFFKIWSSQGILKVRDCTPMEAEEILTYIKRPRNGSVCYFSSKLDVSSHVVHKKKVARILFFKIRSSQGILKIRDVQKKRVARILFFKIRPSQEILKIRDRTPLEAEEILTYINALETDRSSQGILKIRDDVPSNVVQKKRVARILFFKIWSSQGILKVRDCTPMEAEEILTYIKSPRNGSVCYFSSKLDVPSNVVQKKRVARILFFKIRSSQEILKIRDGTYPFGGGGNFDIHKKPSKRIGLSSQGILKIHLDVPSNVVQKKRVARILFFKIWSSQGILKVRDCTPMEAEEILTYIKSPRNGSVCYFSSKLDVPSNVVQKKRVARILFFKIRSSQEILKIRDGTYPFGGGGNFDIHKKPSKRIVARILFFKIRPYQEILKIRDGTSLEAEEILTYIRCPRNGSVCYFSSKLDVSINVVQKKKVAQILFFKIKSSQGILKILARILFFKIWSSQGILKVRDCTPMEAEEILTYIKRPRNGSVCYFSSKLDVSSHVVHKKKVARILFFKIRSSQGILKIRDVQKKRVARILFFKIRPSQEILKIRDGTPLEAEEILTYINALETDRYVPSNVVQKKRVARILFFKIWSSQGILKVRDCTPMEAEEILTYIKSPRNGSVCYFSSKLDVPSNVVQKKRVARILFFKIRSSQEILKIRDGTYPFGGGGNFDIHKKPSKRIGLPYQEILKIRDGTSLEAEEILTYIRCPRNGSVCYFSSKLDVSINVVQKKKVAQILVARILFFKIWSSQGILKVRDCTPMEAEEILTYIKRPRNGSVCYFSSKLDVSSHVVHKKKVARILFFKIRSSQGILKIRDEILKIRDGTPLEAEEILTYINALETDRVARILFFKIRPSQEILKIRDGTPLEAEEILTYINALETDRKLDVPSNVVQKKRVARILFFKIWSSQGILKVRDCTPMEAEEILTYIKSPRNGSVCYFSSKLDVPSNVVQKKRVARILFFKIRSSQEILKIRDGTYPFGGGGNFDIHKKPSKRIVARILFFKIRPYQEILKIRDGTSLEAEEILTYIRCPRNGSVCYFSSKLDVSINVVQKKKVAQILFFKIKSSQGILKILARILFFKIWSSLGILKVRDCTPMEAEEILTYIKRPRNGSVCYFSSKLDVSSHVVYKKKVARILFFKIRSSQGILKIRDGAPMEKRVARILFFKIRPSQEILKIRDGTPLEAEEILTYINALETDRKLDVPSNVVQKKRVARILFFKIWSSQGILKVRDCTPMEAEEILTYIKSPRNGSVCYFSSKLDVPSNVVQKKRVARILFFKIRSSQEILKIRDGTYPFGGGGNFDIHKKPSKRIVQKKRVARILFFKIWSSQGILKVRDCTPLEAEEILTYIKSPRNGSVCYFSSKLDVSSNVVQKKKVARILFFKIRSSQGILKIRDGAPMEKKRVARILFFKIRPSQEILKIRDGTPLEAEEILTYINALETDRKLDVPSNVVQKKRVARILFFKIWSSQGILKVRDCTPMEAEEILTYIKSPRNGSVCYFSSKLDVPSNVVQKKRVARILFFKIRSSQEILKIRDGTYPFGGGGNFDIHKKPSKRIVQKKRVARILFFKIWSSQGILKVRDCTPLEAEEILTYIKSPRNGSVCYFSSKLDVSSNVVQKKKVARILFFKIRSSQGILKIRDGAPMEKKRVARILFFKIRPSQEILKIRDGTPLEAEEILTYINALETDRKLDVPSNVVQKKRVARILFFKIWSSQGILKVRDCTPMEAEEILTYIKSPRNGSVCYFSSKLDVPSNVVQKKRVARILFFKIRSSQEILKIRDGTYPFGGGGNFYIHKKPSKRIVQKKRVARILFFKIWSSQGILKVRDCTPLEAEEILTYIKSPRNGSVCYFSSKLDVSSNVVQKKKVARILFFKIRSSQGILKIRDGAPMEKKRVARILFFKIWSSQGILKVRDCTPLEAEEILTYIKSPRNGSVCYFSSKLDVSSNVVQKKKVARILFFKIRSSQGILKIRDDVPSNVVQKKRVARILFFKIWSSQGILKVRDCTPMEAEEILTYIKRPRNGSVCYFSSKLDVSSHVVHKKKVARILFFKIRSSQGILKIRDDVPSNVVQKKRVARILFFKIWSSQGILKVRDCTPMEAEEILTYIKSPRNGSVCYFSSKLDVPSNVVQKKRVARILFFKIRSSQEILKIRDGTYPFGGGGNFDIHKKPSKRIVARILFFKIRPYQEILKIRDGTSLEAEEILTYIRCPRNGSVCYFSSKLDVSINVVQKKKVAQILFFKIKSSQGILKIRDVQKKRVAQILFFKIWSSQGILKVRDCTPMEAEEILTYIKALETDRVARILFYKIRPSQEILKIRDGTPLEAEEILTYIKIPRNGSVCYFSTKLDVSSNVVQKKKVARILFFKIRSSQGILKIRDGAPMELDVPSNVVQKKRVARILFFKIWSSQGILKVRDCTPMEAEEILTYIKSPRNGSVCYFSSKLDVPSNVVQKKRVARILFFKIRSSQEILKIRDGTYPFGGGGNFDIHKKPSKRIVQKKKVARILFFKIWSSQGILKVRDCTPMEAEEILTYIKSPRNGSVCYFSSKLDVPSNVVQKKRVARILFFKIRSSQEILKIRDGTYPFGGGGNFDIHKKPSKRIGLSSQGILKIHVPSNVVQKKRVARILFFKIWSSQGILKVRDCTPMEAEEILTYIKSPRNGSVCYFSSKLDVSSNVVQKKKVARILFFKIRSSQGILKIRDGAPMELDVSSNVVQKKKVARILFFKIWSSQGILKVRDCTPMEAEEILTYIKSPRNGSVCYFSSKLDVSSNVVQKKKVARILFFKIRSSQGILKIRDGAPMELDVPSNVVQKKRVARILFFKIWSSQGILKVRDCTPMEAEEILTYIKSPRNGSVCYFSSKLDVPSNVVQKKRVARILFFKIRSSQEILKIRDGTYPFGGGGNFDIHKKPSKRIVARILFFKIRPYQEILKIRDGTSLEAEEILTYIRCPRNGSVCYFSSKLDVSINVVQKKKVAQILFFKIKSSQGILKIRDVAQILFFKIWSSQGILKVRDCTPMEAEEILTYIKALETDRVARILFYKIRPSQEILKIRDGTPLEAEEILTYIKIPRNGSVCYFSTKLDVSSNVVQKKKVARILFFKIRSSQGILKIRDGAPMELDVPSNVVQKKRVARILFFKIWSSQGILKVRDCTPMEAEEILTYIKSPRNGSVCYFSSKLDVPSNVVQKKRVARILFFKIRSSQEILKIRDGTYPFGGGGNFDIHKKPSKRIGLSSQGILKIHVSSNVVQKKKVARILFFKIWSSQGILKVRDCTPMEAEEILTYIKSPRNGSVCYFSSKLDVPSNVVQKKRVARILFFKIRSSQEILKIRDGTYPFGGGGNFDIHKKPSKRIGILKIRILKLDVPSNVVQKKRVARILFFKIWSSQGILKVRDCTPMEAEEILTYIKSPRNGSVCYFSSKLDVPSNVVQKKRVARILFFKIRSSQEILKIRDGTYPFGGGGNFDIHKKPSKRIGGGNFDIHKSPRNGSVCYFSSKLDVPSNVVQKKRVARILFYKIRPSQEILKIRDGTPLEAEEILTYIKIPRNGSVCYFSTKLDVSSNVVQKKKVARILFFKIRSSQGILKIRDGAPMELDVPSNVVQKKRVARILFFKIWSSQGILKVRDCTPMEAEEILTYIKSPRNGSVCYFSSKLDVPSNVVQKKRVARILFFKIRSSQEILKIRDGTYPFGGGGNFDIHKKPSKRIVARILFFKIWSSQGILKVRDCTPMEAEEILTYIKSPRNGSVCYFSSKLDVPSNVVQKKRVARILFFKIRSSQEILKIRDGTYPFGGGGNFDIHKKPSKRIEILKIRDGTSLEAEEILTYIRCPRNGSIRDCTPMEAEEILTYIKALETDRVARILFYKIRPSQEILKIRDGTPLEAEEILTYIKIPRNGSVCYFSTKLDVSSNVVQKKKVARILFFKIRSSQGILKIRDGAPMELDVPSNVVQKKRVARILFFKIWSSQGILKVRDCTPMEAEEILTYIKSPRNGSVCYFSSKLDVPSNVVQKKRVARILFFKIRSSQEILKIRDGTYPFGGGGNFDIHKKPSKRIVARILFFKIRPYQEILKIRDGTSLEAEEILTYIRCPRNGSVCYFSSKLDVSINVVQKKKVAQILFFKIKSSQGILKIRGGNFDIHKSPRNGSVCYFSSKLDVPSNVVQKKRVARILFYKIRPSQEILKIRDGTPLEAEEILTYIKIPRNGSVCYFSTKLDVSSNVVQKKKVARILFFKIRSSQGILKIRDGAPMEAEEILTYIKSPRNGS